MLSRDKDRGSNNTASTFGPVKRPNVGNQSNIAIKKQRFEQNSTGAIDFPEGQAFTPIASLTCTRSCPAIRGILSSVSEWRTTSVNTRYANFFLKDSSGQIAGVIFRSMNSKTEETFVIGAQVMVKNAWVRQVKDTYCKDSRIRYELTIPNALRALKVETSTAHDIPLNERTLIKDVLEKVDLRQLVNVIGVVTVVDRAIDHSGNGRQIMTRDFQIIDESSTKIAVTIWNEGAKNFNTPVGTVVAMYQVAQRNQEARQTKSLRFTKNSWMEIDPVSDEAVRLKNWYKVWRSNNDQPGQKNSADYRRVNENCESRRNCEPTREIKTMCDTQIERGINPSSDVVKCPLIPIGEIHRSIELDTYIATVGVATRKPKESLVRTRLGNLRNIRQMEITDELRNCITVDFWERVQDFDIPLYSILLIHRAKVGERDGQKKLDCSNKHIEVNPNNPEILKLGHSIMQSILFMHVKDEGRNINKHRQTTINNSDQDQTLYKTIGKKMFDTSNKDKTAYKTIGAINELCEPGTTVATIGLVVSCAPAVQQNFENGNLVGTKELLLRDHELSEIELVVSGNAKTQRNIRLNSIITVNNATIGIEKNKKILKVDWSDLSLAPELTEIEKFVKIDKKSSAITDVNRPCVSVNKLSNSSTSCKQNIPEKVVKNENVESKEPHVLPGNSGTSRKRNIKKRAKTTIDDSNKDRPLYKTIEKTMIDTSTKDQTAHKTIGAINELCEPGTTVATVGLAVSRVPAVQQNFENGNLVGTKELLLRDHELSEIEQVVSCNTKTQRNIPLNSTITVNEETIRDEKNEKISNNNLADLNLAPETTEIEKFVKIDEKTSAITDENLPCVSFNKLSNSSTPCKQNTPERVVKNENIESKFHLDCFTKIRAINEEIAPGTMIDVFGGIKRRRGSEEVDRSKDAIIKMSVELMDETGDTIWVVISGSKVYDLEEHENLIVAAKKVQVRRCKNRNELGWSGRKASQIVEPEIPEVQELSQRFASLSFTNDSAETETFIRPLTLIRNLRHSDTSNVLGILLKVNELRAIEQTYFRDVARIIVIIDTSEESIDVALYGETARNFAIPEGSVIFFSDIKVYISSKIRGSITPNSIFKIDPPEFQENITKLKSWFAEYKRNALPHSDRSD